MVIYGGKTLQYIYIHDALCGDNKRVLVLDK